MAYLISFYSLCWFACRELFLFTELDFYLRDREWQEIGREWGDDMHRLELRPTGSVHAPPTEPLERPMNLNLRIFCNSSAAPFAPWMWLRPKLHLWFPKGILSSCYSDLWASGTVTLQQMSAFLQIFTVWRIELTWSRMRPILSKRTLRKWPSKKGMSRLHFSKGFGLPLQSHRWQTPQ